MESATPTERSGFAAGAPQPQSPDAPFHSALTPATGEQCTNCGARLAADQRYCVECGERRGEPRFSIADTAAPQAAPAPAAPVRRHARLSPNGTAIAGIGTLLLAMGVGVLIGRTGDHSTTSDAGNQPVRVVNVPSAGATTTPTATAAAAGKAAKAKKAGKSGGGVKGIQTSSVEGKPKEKLPPPTVGLGDKGKGAGYKNGQFTGDFFGK